MNARMSLLLIALLALSGCGKESPDTSKGASPGAKEGSSSASGTPASTPNAPAPPLVMTTFYPTTYFASRIAGDKARVECPVPTDADPIFWQPSDADLTRYQSADLIIINGASFEKWVEHAVLPRTKVLDSCAAIEEPFITFATTTHSHGPEGEHTHEGIDGHTWVDPITAMQQARAIHAGLVRFLPNDRAVLDANLESLLEDLASIDGRWKSLAPRLREATLLASHPAYNYAARRYGLDISNLDLDPGSPLDADAMHDIEHALEGASAGAVRVLLWEGRPLPETVERLEREHAIRSVWVSPGESHDPAAGADFLGVMRANLDRLEAALGHG